MERDFCSKGGSPACVNCSSFSNHSQVVSIKELGSLSHVIKTYLMLLHIAASFQPLQAHDEARTLQTMDRSTLAVWSVSFV